MTTVSIALATYNGEKFLRRQLDTLAAQTQLPDELVVTDDCSTDRTVEILTEFARSAPFPVKVVVNPSQLGFRGNFLKAANLCTSQVILFCDQDDVWRPSKVAVIARAFDEDPELWLAYHDAAIVDGDERSFDTMFDRAAEREALTGDIPPPWHFARGLVQGFRRELLAFDDLWPQTREHFDGERLAHDRWYFTIATAAGRIRFIEEDLLMYRQHGGNLFGSDRRLSRLDRIRERLRHFAVDDAYAAAGARSRVELLRAISPRMPADSHARIDRMAEAYAVYAERMERRVKTYSARSLPARAAALARSLASGDYCGNPWGFDPRSVLRDVWTGVLRGGPNSAAGGI